LHQIAHGFSDYIAIGVSHVPPSLWTKLGAAVQETLTLLVSPRQNDEKTTCFFVQ